MFSRAHTAKKKCIQKLLYALRFLALCISINILLSIILSGCWVGADFIAERIAGEYFWFWFNSLISLVLYAILFSAYAVTSRRRTNDGGRFTFANTLSG